jgi:hypothetical protein
MPGRSVPPNPPDRKGEPKRALFENPPILFLPARPFLPATAPPPKECHAPSFIALRAPMDDDRPAAAPLRAPPNECQLPSAIALEALEADRPAFENPLLPDAPKRPAFAGPENERPAPAERLPPYALPPELPPNDPLEEPPKLPPLRMAPPPPEWPPPLKPPPPP